LLPFLHDEKTRSQPNQNSNPRDQAHTNAGILHIRLVSATVTGPASASILSTKKT
jgi:hypothetical protein